ncbi:hypothetical protein M9H77_22623 [Catharanthus roseus]|uniref:Uncharacterized protein n=1 Tax=Catharanthus roseus TaxID=4058 RepID=A0ACC0ASI0_CATRO|nr:hypothetical protein M9H77_22623 [Catharanthus roseus]
MSHQIFLIHSQRSPLAVVVAYTVCGLPTPFVARCYVIGYHSRRVTCLEFHPIKNNILRSGDKVKVQPFGHAFVARLICNSENYYQFSSSFTTSAELQIWMLLLLKVRHAQGVHNIAGEKDHSAYLSPDLFYDELTPLGWKQVDNLRKHVHSAGIFMRAKLVIASSLLSVRLRWHFMFDPDNDMASCAIQECSALHRELHTSRFQIILASNNEFDGFILLTLINFCYNT